VKPTTALVLDDDLGFCMWLGRALNDAGIRTLPACTSEEAMAIAADFRYRIDVVIVNLRLQGCDKVLAQNRGAKVIAIGAAGKLAVDGRIQRPRGKTLPPPDRYVKTVTAVLHAGGTRLR
jgi:ActR/RegA family two-component response regulator